VLEIEKLSDSAKFLGLSYSKRGDRTLDVAVPSLALCANHYLVCRGLPGLGTFGPAVPLVGPGDVDVMGVGYPVTRATRNRGIMCTRCTCVT
jgi:hypothetical protein